ncbi:bone morphogenetic protein 7-like isoform X1 [Haliotis rubra]|uniref:bone morphogenetic protein 7-like isoform X1 n=1 Tax=Haliotis rubra TaxID=36100 RepID=UPI001EE50998|nr:bone morphogenetic protein 7-like isoform X1 [Haliotis rubra]
MEGLRCRWLVRTTIAISLVLGDVTGTYSTMSTAFYADNDLQQTVLVTRLPGREKREMQQEILTLLGLHQKPKPKTHGKGDSAPKFMMDLYEKLKNEDGEMTDDDTVFRSSPRNASVGLNPDLLDGSDVIMSFVNHEGRVRKLARCPRQRNRSEHGYASLCRRSANKFSHLRHERDRTFYFDFSEVAVGEHVSGSELRLYKERAHRSHFRHQDFHIELFRMKQGRDPEDKVLESELNTTIKGDYRGWLRLNVTGAAEKWTRNPGSNLGLYMKITGARGQDVDPRPIGIVGRRGSTAKQPFLVGYFRMDTELHERRRRSARRRSRQDVTYADQPSYPGNFPRFQRKACQRRTLYVSFRDLGWQDWIIAPDGYSAFYCDGECAFPLGAHMNATNHAIVQTLVHLMDPFMAPKPCCAPTKLTAISVLYFDHNSNVVLKKYKGMIVKACGCH